MAEGHATVNCVYLYTAALMCRTAVHLGAVQCSTQFVLRPRSQFSIHEIPLPEWHRQTVANCEAVVLCSAALRDEALTRTSCLKFERLGRAAQSTSTLRRLRCGVSLQVQRTATAFTTSP